VYQTGYLDGAKEDMAVKHLEAAAAIVDQESDSVEKGLVYQRTGHMYLHRGQPGTTLEWARRAVDLFTRLGVPMGTSLGTALTYTGQPDAGLAYNEGNWQPVVKAGIPLVIAVLGHELTLTLALLRNIPRARELGEQALAELLKVTHGRRSYLEPMVRRPLALIYTLAGDRAQAEDTCRWVEDYEKQSLHG